MKKLIKHFFNFFFLYMKMTNKYYEKHIEKLQKEAREICQNVSGEKDEKLKTACEGCQNFNEDEK